MQTEKRTSQREQIRELLSDHKPHSSFEIVSKVYKANGPSVARLSGRISELKLNDGLKIISVKSKKNNCKQWYMLPACLMPDCRNCGECFDMVKTYDSAAESNA